MSAHREGWNGSPVRGFLLRRSALLRRATPVLRSARRLRATAFRAGRRLGRERARDVADASSTRRRPARSGLEDPRFSHNGQRGTGAVDRPRVLLAGTRRVQALAQPRSSAGPQRQIRTSLRQRKARHHLSLGRAPAGTRAYTIVRAIAGRAGAVHPQRSPLRLGPVVRALRRIRGAVGGAGRDSRARHPAPGRSSGSGQAGAEFLHPRLGCRARLPHRVAERAQRR